MIIYLYQRLFFADVSKDHNIQGHKNKLHTLLLRISVIQIVGQIQGRFYN